MSDTNPAPSVRDGIEARVGYAGFVDGTFELIVEAMNGKSVTLSGKLQPGQSERMAEILPTCVMVPVALAAAPVPDQSGVGGNVGELERLSAAATPGPWSVSGCRERYDEPSCVIVDSPMYPGVLALATASGAMALEALADARFIVALVNAYRSGKLVLASTEGGERTGAPATPEVFHKSPSPHPDDKTAGMTVKEARGVLAGIHPAFESPQVRTEFLRWCGGDKATAEASRIETALLTLQSERGDLE